MNRACAKARCNLTADKANKTIRTRPLSKTITNTNKWMKSHSGVHEELFSFEQEKELISHWKPLGNKAFSWRQVFSGR